MASGLKGLTPRVWRQIFLALIIGVSYFLLMGTQLAIAGVDDDRFEGNIFALYAGNGSLVPPKVSLAASLKQHKPALLVFYLDDSRDCKQFVPVISQLQAFYGRAASLIPVNIDTIRPNSYTPAEPGYYYRGFVPQTVLLDQSGEIVFNAKGSTTFEQIDDVFREVFNLLPRSESVELKRRPVNEFSTELRK